MRELLNNDALLAITEKMLGKKIGKDNIYKIQQAGTKYVGHVYFDVADDFLYECIAQTTGTTNTTSNFKKCGIGENRDKLDNLLIKTSGTIEYSYSYSIPYSAVVDGYRYIEIDFDMTLYDEIITMLISYGSSKPTNECAIFSMTTMNYIINACTYISAREYLKNNMYIVPKVENFHTKPFSIVFPIESYTRITLQLLSTSKIDISSLKQTKLHKTLPTNARLISVYI